jgi:hypothetical protein
VGEDFHLAGMIESFTKLGFALETGVQSGIAFDLRVGDFDGDLPAITHIRAAKNRRHAAAGNKAFNAVMIELIAGMERVH